MNRKACTLFALLTLVLLFCGAPARTQVAAVPKLMHFQGRLSKPDGTPVPDGTYSIRFRFYDAASGGSVKHEQTFSNVPVRNGIIAVLIGLFSANAFDGNTWLGIQVGNDAEILPRTQIVSVPYAVKSDLALTVPDGSLTNAKLAPGTLTADRFASGIFNPLAWLLGGNSGVTGGFLGTTDNQPLVFKVNGRRAMRYQYAENPAGNYRSINVLGGSEINTIAAGVVGATIAGGGQDNFSGGDAPNAISAHFGTIGGGRGNTVTTLYATIGGGHSNTASGTDAFVGGGAFNSASGAEVTISGGYFNSASGNDIVVAGGSNNAAQGTFVTVGGGTDNNASGDGAVIAGGNGNATLANNASVGGGNGNRASATYATVSGGFGNTASGSFATVAGGTSNTALGTYSFAAGGRAKANHSGTFVWKSYNGSDFASTGNNQFLISAAGGVGINTADPAGFALNVNGSLRCVGLTDASDARWKTHIAELADPLEAVLRLHGVAYDWKEVPGMNFPDGRQIGFLAQEVEEVLPELVTTDARGYKSVAYAHVVPVLVEAIKTLKKENDVARKENGELRATLNEVLRRLKALESERAHAK